MIIRYLDPKGWSVGHIAQGGRLATSISEASTPAS